MAGDLGSNEMAVRYRFLNDMLKKTKGRVYIPYHLRQKEAAFSEFEPVMLQRAISTTRFGESLPEN